MSRTPRNEDIALMDINPLENRTPPSDQAVGSPARANYTKIFFSRRGWFRLISIGVVLFITVSTITTTQNSGDDDGADEWIEDEPYRHICIDYQWHEIEYQCKRFYNSTPRCDLTAEEDDQMLKKLQACCEDDDHCWPRKMDEYCCLEQPCDHHKCRNPMPANGTSLVSEAIMKIQLKQEEEREGEGIFSKKILTQKQKKLIVKLHKVLNSKNLTAVLEFMGDSTSIVFNNKVVRSPTKLTSFLEYSMVNEHRIHLLIDVEQRSQREYATVFFKGFMCNILPNCFELQVTFKWSPRRNDYFIKQFKNNKSIVKPNIDDYPFWGGDE
ncbi:unnamed protein product [Caenorhabditis auriculariae]|uniref:Uncharacterized protein n=1 Tax=Caenorhabditis auriculariae TaxID=2777116 RepID=A0A8S1HNQ7_9PELO|nr:unnamed protein product [Caenorhabditis auriculariae]